MSTVGRRTREFEKRGRIKRKQERKALFGGAILMYARVSQGFGCI